MKSISPYPHGGDLSIYPTVAVMTDAYVGGFYRTYPHEARLRIGPLPALPAGASESALASYAEARSRCHAVIVMPRKVVLLRFARRAMRRDIERIEHEVALLAQTPELEPVSHWRIEARLVHCDIADGVEAEARARGIRLALYRPRWLATHRPKSTNRPEDGIVLRKLNPRRLAVYAAAHSGSVKHISDQAGRASVPAAWLALFTHERRGPRNSKANCTPWARMSADAARYFNERTALINRASSLPGAALMPLDSPAPRSPFTFLRASAGKPRV